MYIHQLFVFKSGYCYFSFQKNKAFRIVPEKFTLDTGVHGEISVTEKTQEVSTYNSKGQSTKMDHTVTHYTITIESETKTIAELTTLMDKWEENYIDYQYSSSGLKYFRFNPDGRKEVLPSPSYRSLSLTQPSEMPQKRFMSISAATKYGHQIYDEYPFQSGTNFDNIFFAQKSDLKSQIEHFVDNPQWYEKRGLKHSLTFLFHGGNY